MNLTPQETGTLTGSEEGIGVMGRSRGKHSFTNPLATFDFWTMGIQQALKFFIYIRFLWKELTINSHRRLEDNHLRSPVLISSSSRNPSGPWKTAALEPGGAAVQTEHGANSPTLVYTVKKFLFTTYSWESGQGPDGPGLALAWVLLQIFHPSNPKAEKSKVGWW